MEHQKEDSLLGWRPSQGIQLRAGETSGAEAGLHRNTVIWRSRLARSRAVSNVAPSEVNAMLRPGYRALNLHEWLVIADPAGRGDFWSSRHR